MNNQRTKGYRRVLSAVLVLITIIVVCTFAVLIYWSTRDEPIEAPSAPQGEATIPAI